jgi:hypothetical protein
MLRPAGQVTKNDGCSDNRVEAGIDAFNEIATRFQTVLRGAELQFRAALSDWKPVVLNVRLLARCDDVLTARKQAASQPRYYAE